MTHLRLLRDEIDIGVLANELDISHSRASPNPSIYLYDRASLHYTVSVRAPLLAEAVGASLPVLSRAFEAFATAP